MAAPRLAPAGTRARLLLAALALGVSLWTDNGTLAPMSLPFFVACLGLLGWIGHSLGKPTRTSGRLDGRWLWPLLLGVPALLNVIRPLSESALPGTSWLPHALLCIGLAVVGLYGVRRGDRGGLALLALLAYLAVGGYLLRHTPGPRIDVFVIEQHGAAALLAGRDPYAAHFPNPYTAAETLRYFGQPASTLDHYPYPPLSLLVTTLGYWLGGDVRVSLLALHAATGLLLYLIGRRSGLGLALLACHLLHPRGFMVVESAWTEPLLGAAFAFWALRRERPGRPAPLTLFADGARLALVLSAKQYAALLLPLFVPARLTPPWLRQRRGAALAVALLLTATLLLGFLAWHPADFIEDVVRFQLRQPFRTDALSLPSLLCFLTGIQLPGALSLVGAAVALGWVWRRLPDGTAGVALGATFLLMGFFAFAKQAFCNYYYLVGVLLLLSAGLVREEGAAATERSRGPEAQ